MHEIGLSEPLTRRHFAIGNDKRMPVFASSLAPRGFSTSSLAVMKTYPHARDDGSIRHFEISNSFWWSPGPMRRVLQSVAGVTNVRRNWFNDDRFSFTFYGRTCVVNEPFGDNGRYWIGPTELEQLLDIKPIHEAFRQFRFRYTFDAEFKE